jgi:hypothetical protein
MKLLELFAGSRSVGKAAEALEFDVFSIDWKGFDGIDLVADIGKLKLEDVPWVPDVVWASPDCTTYSIAACSTHRINSIHPKSEYAIKCDEVNQHFLALIHHWRQINPDLVYFVENPRGMLRKMPFMRKHIRRTVWYCQYGDDRAKPTDIFTNSQDWVPRPQCFNGNPNCHHQSAPRGSRTGTQGRKGSYERSFIPAELCREILLSTIKK